METERIPIGHEPVFDDPEMPTEADEVAFTEMAYDGKLRTEAVKKEEKKAADQAKKKLQRTLGVGPNWKVDKKHGTQLDAFPDA